MNYSAPPRETTHHTEKGRRGVARGLSKRQLTQLLIASRRLVFNATSWRCFPGHRYVLLLYWTIDNFHLVYSWTFDTFLTRPVSMPPHARISVIDSVTAAPTLGGRIARNWSRRVYAAVKRLV